METSLFAFPADLADEGVEAVLDNVQHRAGVRGITLATVYHEARDILPHNPRGKVRFLEPGAACFRPDGPRYREAGLEPRTSASALERDILEEAVEATGRRGLSLYGWTVFLHTDWVRDPRPDLSERNAFGDPMLTELCPANPVVRAYVRALCADIGSRGVRSIVAESLHYHPLEHGFHHERYFLPLGVTTRFLLGLCFCPHCLGAASGDGVDGELLRRFARDRIQRAFDEGDGADAPSLSREEVAALAGEELGGFLTTRARVVASLAAEAAQAAASEGAVLSFLDASGAVKGYATGMPEGGPAAEIAWQLGVDLAAIGKAAGLEAIAYAAEPQRVALDLAAYRELLPDGGSLAAAMRPMLPDCATASNLAEKLRIAGEGGVERIDFYHYGLAPLTALDRIRAALRADGGTAEPERPAG